MPPEQYLGLENKLFLAILGYFGLYCTVLTTLTPVTPHFRAQIWTITIQKITSHKMKKDKSLTPYFSYFRPLDLGKNGLP